jgi:uridine kinase
VNIVIPKPFDGEAEYKFLETAKAALLAQTEPIVDAIFEREGVVAVLIDGTVCSGKKGVALELKKRIEERGRLAKVISMADFLKNRASFAEECKKRGVPMRQEAIGALDFTYFEKCLDLIFSEETALLPGYDYKEGVRCSWIPFTARENHVILIEGSYAMSPRVRLLSQAEGALKVYVDTISGYESNRGAFLPREIRLARKFARDHRKHGRSAEQIYQSWMSANEEQRPYSGGLADLCDFKVDTTSVHEPMILKNEINKTLGSIKSNSKIYAAGKKFLSRFSEFPDMESDLIEKDSFYSTFL